VTENEIICGDNMEVMATFPDNSIDTIITDPPYGLGFMGKEWDTFKPDYIKTGWRPEGIKTGINSNVSKSPSKIAGTYDHSRNAEFQQWFTIWAKEVLRIAKPGAIMMVFGGTRTYHRLTCAIEDAGWQIRDCMMWLYGSGFPKSLDISKAIDKAKGAKRKIVGEDSRPAYDSAYAKWDKPYKKRSKNFGQGKWNITIPTTNLAKRWEGYGTALKPAWEPIIVAMKPLDGTFAHNAEKWGVGGLWIDGGRIGTNAGWSYPNGRGGKGCFGKESLSQNLEEPKQATQGRWPANVILDEESAAMLDEQSGVSKSNPTRKNKGGVLNTGSSYGQGVRKSDWNGPGDSGGASRFFYCAKASRSERNAGLEGIEKNKPLGNGFGYKINPMATHNKSRNEMHKMIQNNHPTVKPLKLMEYLCKLTRTPTGGIVLDPFGGSGTTALACQNTGRNYLLIEKDPHYCEIARARIRTKGLFAEKRKGGS